jgi:hypothetical protein
MELRLLAGLALVGLLGLATPSVAGDKVSVGLGGETPGTSSNFTLVGANPLAGRGMNAALAIYRRYVYVGNRTDGSNRCGAGDPRGAVDPTPARTRIRESWSSTPSTRPTRPSSASSARSS